MSKISDLNLVGDMVETDQLLALRSGANVRVNVGALTGGGNSNLSNTAIVGDGTTTDFLLSADPLNENNTQIYVDGVYQNKSTYSVSGTTLTFSEAPPSGTAVEVMIITPTNVAVTTIADNTITSAKLSGDLVTPGALDVTGTVTADGLTVDTSDQVIINHSADGGGIRIDSTNATNTGSLRFGDVADNYIGAVEYNHTNDSMSFYANNATRMTITSAGNVGIGTSSPSQELHVKTTGSQVEVVLESSGQTSSIFNNTNAAFGVIDGATERLRIDSSGNLLVGKTAPTISTTGVELRPNGQVFATQSGNYSLLLNRTTSDGAIAQFRKDGTTVGSIGVAQNSTYIGGSGNGAIYFNGQVDVRPWNKSTQANLDNIMDLGSSSSRWDDIYATNGTIQTSDRNEKQDIAELSDAEQRVAVAAKGLLRKFRWISSVEENGDDARIHFGIIAQDLQDAFTAEGLDAGRYAMFTSNTWTDEVTGEERTRLGVRYVELLAFIISAI